MREHLFKSDVLIPTVELQRLGESMPKCTEAALEAHGWSTHFILDLSKVCNMSVAKTCWYNKASMTATWCRDPWGDRVRPYLSRRLQGAISGLLVMSRPNWRQSECRSRVRQGGARCTTYLHGANLCSFHGHSEFEHALSNKSRYRSELCHWPESEARAKRCKHKPWERRENRKRKWAAVGWWRFWSLQLSQCRSQLQPDCGTVNE